MIDEFNNNLPIAIREMIILRQKEYARRDYEGLNEKQSSVLKQQRSQLAKQVRESRRKLANEHKYETPFEIGTKSRVGKYFDLEGNKHSLGKQTFAKGQSAKDVKFNQQSDRLVQNEALLDELKAKKEDLREHIKKMGKPKNINPTNSITTPKPNKQAAEGFIKRNWNKLGTGGKIAAVAIPSVAALGTGIAVRNKNKKED